MIDAPEKHASARGAIREVSLYQCRGTANGTSRHATTHTRPRCPYPGSRAGHGGERTGFQFAKSYRGYTQSPARSQYFEWPNTRAVAGAFAVAGHRRTDIAARAQYATHPSDARRGPFRSPTDAGPFRFPIPDGSLASRAAKGIARYTTEAPVASIGGAGTFDGIFLTAILAVLIAGLSPALPAQATKPARETQTYAPPVNDKRA